MILSWFQRRRRRKLLAEPFPQEWLEYLRRNVSHYGFLSETEQSRLRDDLRIFITEKHWEGCGGLTMTDEIKVTIAAQACLLLLGLKHNYFERVQSILVYPSGYRVKGEQVGRDGLIHERGEGRLGEAWYRGPVILAWDEVRYDAQNPGQGQNLVFHEFAHQLDMLDGQIDGTPPLETPEQYQRWREVMTAEYEQLIRASELGRATLLDQYGTTDEGEFFAVATECFFERPVALQRRHPRLYEILRDYYHQDPAARCTACTN
jgi:Mlc titration factor MtfA (ptsG expression regulator)